MFINLNVPNDIDRYIKLVENFDFICAVECDDVLISVHKTRSKVQLDKFNYIVFVLIENAKLFLYKAIKEYFEKYLDRCYHYTDTNSMFINLNVPIGDSNNEEKNQINRYNN